MDSGFVWAVALFAIVMVGTPGPNNVMLTNSGANFGYIRSIPHFIGIGVGLISLLLLNGAGLGVVFTSYPVVQEVLKWLGSAYLLYLAWRILTAKRGAEDEAEDIKPMNSFEAILFQYINPKAWMMCITAVSSFSLPGEQYWQSLAVICATFLLVQLPTSSVWVGFGIVIRQWLSTPLAWRRFNRVMSLLTVLCIAFIW
ncbi:LysE family translocator [Vibrio hippocampi]|uniref:LysE family translocator n=1 Tax=Vibrio hippocampi TaxID=654686 RepID=A0ABN8DFI9_9VIBR|nr:LysE family translocator [Vibrio hippocampi]CAH0524567.1 hypothetical protein VHP8226_00405 [Vibrio hippocampi]